ncbi:MAG: hypothetical protein QM504_18110 [Pseudomonadota bacterium]
MSIELYNKDGHLCIAFENNNKGGGIQANQFLIANNNEGVLLDPGGIDLITQENYQIVEQSILK